MGLAATKMTSAEFLALPEDPLKTRYELVHGEVVVSPSPNLSHGFASVRLSSLLVTHVGEHDLGLVLADVDTYFTAEDVRRPDIFYFRKERLEHIGEQYVEAPPDLCIEILSPSNAQSDRVDKFNLYRDCGVGFYWIVDPMKHTMEGYRLERGDYVLSGKGKLHDTLRLPPFPDLAIPLGDLWFPELKKPSRRSK